MTSTKISESPLKACTLCQTPLKGHFLKEGNNYFCCPGCQAVSNILQAKGVKKSAQMGSSVFQEALRFGIISNPDLLKKISEQKKSNPHKILKAHLEISDMWCFSCSKLIEYVLSQTNGVIKVYVDYPTDLLKIEYDPYKLNLEEIKQQIHSLGYEAKDLSEIETTPVGRSLWLRFFAGTFFALNVMMFSYPVYASLWHPDQEQYPWLFAYLAFAASLPVVSYSAYPIWKRWIKGVMWGFYGMETLVTLAVLSAFSLSCWNLFSGRLGIYFDSMCVIIVLILLGKMIEAKAKFSARRSLVSLQRSLVKKARKKMNEGEETFVSLDEIKVGDTLISYPGEKVALDGEVLQSLCTVDESSMTGESLPVSKKSKDRVLAGCIVLSGNLEYRVTRLQKESVLSQIIDALSEDISKKKKYERAADKITQIFIPLVLTLAILSALFCVVSYFYTGLEFYKQEAFMRFLSVLLISCPCALGIAAPLAESVLIQKLFDSGIMIKNRAVLASIGEENLFVFDKTGTLTRGKLTLQKGLEHLSDDEKSILKALTQRSSHPICKSIYHNLLATNVPLFDFIEHIGKGVEAKTNQKQSYYLGSASFMKALGFLEEKHAQNQQELTSYFASKQKGILSILYFEDALREQAFELIESLGPSNCVLLSGDRQAVVQKVASELRISNFRAECSPLDKKAFIEEKKAQGFKVCFVGDGVNDAPALCQADLSLSVLKASDISIHVSDVFLIKDDISLLLDLQKQGKKGQKVLKQNLFWAFFYNSLGVILACFGYLHPLFAAFAMVLSSLMVITNSLRLKAS